MRQIFRKQALERLGSPEQLDQLMQLTSPRAWVALVAMGLILITALLWAVLGSLPITVDAQGVLMRRGGIRTLQAPFAGTVSAILVASGQKVEKGQELVRLLVVRPGKAEIVPVVSPFGANVLRRRARIGEIVEKGASLLILDPINEPLHARLFIPLRDGYHVQRGRPAQVWPTHVKRGEFGYLLGKVQFATKFPITMEEMQTFVGNEALVRQFSQSGSCLQANIELTVDLKTISGYRWSSSRGASMQLFSGTPCDARIVISSQRPIALVFPGLFGSEGL